MFKVVPKTKYLAWWELADKYPNMIKMCEVMARLVCNSRKRKTDDLRLKSSSYSLKECTACDLYMIEKLRHVIMQCPSTEQLRTQMFCELNKINNELKTLLQDHCAESFEWILGKEMDVVDRDTMHAGWTISGDFISRMYYRLCMNRIGVG